jgi:carbon storage regulator CsrA
MDTHSTTPAPEPRDDPRRSLVVERTSGESVVIGGEVEITLLRVIGDRAHIGVTTPEGVPVTRSELYRE